MVETDAVCWLCFLGDPGSADESRGERRAVALLAAEAAAEEAWEAR